MALNQVIESWFEFWNLYNLKPDDLRLKKFKNEIEKVMPLFEQFNVDYKAILLEKLGGDKNKLKDLLNLFEIE